MTTISNTVKRILSGFILLAVCLLFSQSTFSQDKPKGKPWPAPESAIKMKSAVKADEAAMKEGKDIYAQQCKSCHGAKGKGDGAKAAKLDISCGDFTSEEFMKESEGASFWRTTEGRKPMPSFKEKLSDSERWKVVAYIHSLGK